LSRKIPQYREMSRLRRSCSSEIRGGRRTETGLSG
jgi:hypothetical protein